jgi:hypothetical protein
MIKKHSTNSMPPRTKFLVGLLGRSPPVFLVYFVEALFQRFLAQIQEEVTVKNLKLWLALLAILAVASHASAQSVSFASGFPATGSSGTIVVQGAFTVNCGWTPKSNVVTVRVWQNGDVVTSTDFTITYNPCMPFSWGPFAVSGLTSGATYNVTAEMTYVQGTMELIIVTDPVAKPAG